MNVKKISQREVEYSRASDHCLIPKGLPMRYRRYQATPRINYEAITYYEKNKYSTCDNLINTDKLKFNKSIIGKHLNKILC